MRTSNSSFFYTKINGKGDYYEKNILWWCNSIKEMANPSQTITRYYPHNIYSQAWAYLRRISNPNALRDYIGSLEVSGFQKECYNTGAIKCLDKYHKIQK